jgi:hypothetical protein
MQLSVGNAAPESRPSPGTEDPTTVFGRGRRITVRVLSVLGLLTFSFMLVLAVLDAGGRVGAEPSLVQPGSAAARFGADHPGEVLHLVGAAAALSIGGTGLIGLAVRPQGSGSARHVLATAFAMVVVAVLVGDPDNHGGQAGPVDALFVVMALPPLAAALAAGPWRVERTRAAGIRVRLPMLAVAAFGLPWLWYGRTQGLLQRESWPPLADPHHQAHWYAMALLAVLIVLTAAAAVIAAPGWRTAATAPAVAALAVATASLLAPTAASALTPVWAIAALLWGAALLALTWRPMRS